MSLGGMRDEAEIRGHRRTYIGSMPGRIMQAIKRAGTRNPVFMLDEIDKVGSDWRGDPSSALLEVLDPAQNGTFRDHYLNVDFDLSDVMFVTTANQLEPIPAPLRDRMEIIPLDGYTEHEKVKIAQEHLVKRQVAANGLRDGEVVFSEEALRKIVQDYTREAGVRTLERQIGAICRKSVTKIASGDSAAVEITPEVVREYLKKEKFDSDTSETIEIPGIATGLAVTPVGGDILFIEATRMKGKGDFTLTGQLGDVMRESARIAHSYVRSKAAGARRRRGFFCPVGRARPRSRGSHPQGRSLGRRCHGHGNCQPFHRQAGAGGYRDDGRGDAARARPAHRRGQDEGACRAPGGPHHGDPAETQRTGPRRPAGGRAHENAVRAGGQDR